jgi:hypothetical protein
VIARKLNGLTEAELRSSHLPSGWTPLELLKHLVHMEARWLRWGFMAEQLPQPWGDEDESGRWHVGLTLHLGQRRSLAARTSCRHLRSH